MLMKIFPLIGFWDRSVVLFILGFMIMQQAILWTAIYVILLEHNLSLIFDYSTQ